jgi:hypothetical protein
LPGTYKRWTILTYWNTLLSQGSSIQTRHPIRGTHPKRFSARGYPNPNEGTRLIRAQEQCLYRIRWLRTFEDTGHVQRLNAGARHLRGSRPGIHVRQPYLQLDPRWNVPRVGPMAMALSLERCWMQERDACPARGWPAPSRFLLACQPVPPHRWPLWLCTSSIADKSQVREAPLLLGTRCRGSLGQKKTSFQEIGSQDNSYPVIAI